jgi:hypothetical protein
MFQNQLHGQFRGYNIDFSTSEYVDYVSDLIELHQNDDLYSSDLMNRFFSYRINIRF